MKDPKPQPAALTPFQARPQYLMTLWQDESGEWRGRLKSLTDGAEQPLSDLADLPRLLRKDPHAQA